MNTRLFAFAGACGTGKTTLLNEVTRLLEEHDLSVLTITEVARSVFEKYNLESLTDMRAKPEVYMQFQVDILNEQIRRERDARTALVDVVLSDRSVIDNMVYFLTWCSREINPQLFDYYIETVYHRVFEESSYQTIFLVPPFGKKIDDGFRTKDLEYQEQQHMLAYMLTKSFDRTVIVEGSSIESRKDFVLNKILDYYPEHQEILSRECIRL